MSSNEIPVISGQARAGGQEVTLFDSTGLAIQDLAICQAVYEARKDGRLEAPTAPL